MAQSKNSFLSALASSVTSSGTVPSAALAPEVTSSIEGAGTAVYDSASLLPIVGNTAGDTAFVKSTSRLYIHSGLGWYNVAVINNTPTVQSITDSNGGTTPFTLATDGTPTTITITAQDSDGDPLTYNYSTDSGFAGLATLSQDANVFTITPYSEDSATTTSGTITFSVTDGINTATPGAQTFALNFGIPGSWSPTDFIYYSGVNGSTILAITREGTIWVSGDGYRVLFAGRTGGVVRAYDLATPYELTTTGWTARGATGFNNEHLYGGAIWMKPDDYSQIWICDADGSEEIHRFDVSTTNIASFSNKTTYTMSDPAATFYCYNMGFSTDGYKFWAHSGQAMNIWDLSTAFDLSTKTADTLDWTTTSLAWGIQAFSYGYISADGKKLAAIHPNASNTSTEEFSIYNIPTAWDLTSITSSDLISTLGLGWNAIYASNGMWMPNGDNMYVYDRATGVFKWYVV